MNRRRRISLPSRRKQAGAIKGLAGAAALAALGTGAITSHLQTASAQVEPRVATQSSPIAITRDNRFVASVNPDNDSVSVFHVENDTNRKVAEVAVGKEPWCVAIKESGNIPIENDEDAKLYVANMASGTVSVITAKHRNTVKTIQVGTEPFGCALTPDGSKLFVTNQSSENVSVIDTKDDRVIATIERVGTKPHGIGITADGKKVYVTQLFSERPAPGETRPLTQTEGADDGRVGRVTVIDAQSHQVLGQVVLNPLANTGFFSDGNTLAREPLSAPAAPVFDNVTRAFPNLLESVTIRGNLAYVPGTCSSPNGPFRFNVNVQSCLSVIDTGKDLEAFGAGTTLNMNQGVGNEAVGKRLFNTNPFAVAFKRSTPEGFVALAATDRLLRVTLDAGGRPSINPPANAQVPGNIVRIELKDPNELVQPDPDYIVGGFNPRGLVLDSRDTRAYVMNFISRDIAVVDVSGADPTQYKTLARIQSAGLPTLGTVDAIAHRGKQLFNSSIGPEGAAENSTRPAGRMSDFGWGTCYSCHVNGLADSVTWMFPDGPRQAISMESTFTFGKAVIENGVPKLPESHQRALNWSAVRDEVQDFTRNIRAVSGGGGLILVDGAGNPVPEGVAGLGQVPDLRPTANSGLNANLDAIATYLAVGVRAPISPLGPTAPRVNEGRALFQAAGCQSCHGGANWTTSIIDYTPPPAANEVVDAQLVRFLCRVGTFDASLFADGKSNEIRANALVAGAGANVQARGALGFNVPSLISVFASAPYLHSGAAPTLGAVLDNVTHRSAGSGGIDTLTNANDRAGVVRFLESIDRDTEPFLNVTRPSGVCGPTP